MSLIGMNDRIISSHTSQYGHDHAGKLPPAAPPRRSRCCTPAPRARNDDSKEPSWMRSDKAAWVLLVFAFPLVGPVVWFIRGRKSNCDA